MRAPCSLLGPAGALDARAPCDLLDPSRRAGSAGSAGSAGPAAFCVASCGFQVKPGLFKNCVKICQDVLRFANKYNYLISLISS